MVPTEAVAERLRLDGRCLVTTSRRACGAVLVAAVRGSVDIATIGELERVLTEGLARGNFSRLVVDLSSLTFLSAAGLRCLVRACASAQDQGLDMRVVPGRGAVARILDACGAVPVADTVDSACDLRNRGLQR